MEKTEKEEFHMKLKIPKFVKILDETIREEVLKEVEEKIKPNVEEEFRLAAKEAISKRLEFVETPEEVSKEVLIKEKIPAATPLIEQVSQAKKIKNCPKCGKEIDMKTKFCRFCGAIIEQAAPPREQVSQAKKIKNCPKCGKEIDMKTKFCRFCGAKL